MPRLEIPSFGSVNGGPLQYWHCSTVGKASGRPQLMSLNIPCTDYKCLCGDC